MLDWVIENEVNMESQMNKKNSVTHCKLMFSLCMQIAASNLLVI